MAQLTTTLNRIREKSPCHDGWTKLLTGLGKTKADDEPLAFSRIAEINGIEDALWCCQCEPQFHKTWRLFAVWCARQVEHFMIDQRSKDALNVAERHANGIATDEELAAAWAAAWAAAGDAAAAAGDAWAAAGDAAAAAWAAAGAAWAAAGAAAWAAAGAAAGDAAAAAGDAAGDAAAAAAAAGDAAAAAGDAAGAAAGDAWAAQLAKFIEMTNEGE